MGWRPEEVRAGDAAEGSPPLPCPVCGEELPFHVSTHAPRELPGVNAEDMSVCVCVCVCVCIRLWNLVLLWGDFIQVLRLHIVMICV